MQKVFCDGCGVELQEGAKVISLRASVSTFEAVTPGQESVPPETINYAKEYHAECWTAGRAESLTEIVAEPREAHFAGWEPTAEPLATETTPTPSEPQAEPDAPKDEGSGNAPAGNAKGNLGGNQEPIIPQAPEPDAAPVETPQEEKGSPVEEEEAPSDMDANAESRGVSNSTIPPGTNP